ncbi:zinc finger CCCH domain-containing protein 15-like [Carassius auratus]|uniref:Zinc finger CCCH domain-containing protein 15-like n=1 Tax=Carassius auratus TaxID=7957 RepID=A0A6P6KST2_CARAU|nr:zinc finger CCCH domain-containing protein 15-like [Carassius auratus]XP_026074512.1 zinc finger CCCH domain-containing protein 15-like [Carassius auratus]
MDRKKAVFKADRAIGVSGREVFEFRPELVDDDDEEADDTKYSDDDDTEVSNEMENAEEVQDIPRFIPKEVDYAGITVATGDRFTAKAPTTNDTDDNKLSEASGGAVENGELGQDQTLEDGETNEEESEAVPVDENLFTGEDLDELEEELNTLDLDE